MINIFKKKQMVKVMYQVIYYFTLLQEIFQTKLILIKIFVYKFDTCLKNVAVLIALVQWVKYDGQTKNAFF